MESVCAKAYLTQAFNSFLVFSFGIILKKLLQEFVLWQYYFLKNESRQTELFVLLISIGVQYLPEQGFHFPDPINNLLKKYFTGVLTKRA